jgi:2'-5' RNA ligase
MPKFSIAQFDLPEYLASRVRRFAAGIPDDMIAEDGREDTPHITIKYGLHTNDSEVVAKVLDGQKPISVSFGKTSIFAGSESGEDFDVLKIEVYSPDLVELNKLLSERLDHTTTHPVYTPHVTIAFLRAGLGQEFIDSGFLDDEEFIFNSVIFSSAEGKRSSIYLPTTQETKSFNGDPMKSIFNPSLYNPFIILGESVKALDNGHVEGYLVRFGSAKDTDLEGEYFTKNTDFGFEDGDDLNIFMKSPIYYAHALDPVLAKRKIGTVKMKRDSVGVWVEGQLNLSDDYEKGIQMMAKAGKLGWSSGTAPHLVTTKSVGKATEILSWPLGLDASLTPRPAEYRNRAVLPLKSIKSFMGLDDDSLSIKGLFESKLSEQLIGYWDLQDALRSAATEIVKAAMVSDVTNVLIDIPAKVSETVTEYASYLIPLMVNQIREYLVSGRQEDFYLKTTEALQSLTESKKGGLLVRLPLTEHSDAVLAAVKELNERASRLQDIRTKEGRKLGVASRQKLTEFRAALDEVCKGVDLLLEDSMPKTDDTAKSVKDDAFRRLSLKHRHLALTTNLMSGETAA